MTPTRLPVISVALLAALALGAGGAAAATPIGGAAYKAHDHSVEGQGWHVDARVSGDGRVVKMLVLYSERCGGHTPLAEDLEVGPDGEVSATGPLSRSKPEAGSYEFVARFVTERRLEGTFRFAARSGCDTGPIPFVARTKTRAHEHGDGEEHSHHAYGHPVGTMPELDSAPPRALRQAESLWRRTLRAARRFATIGAAIDRGFARQSRRFGVPVIFHVRSHAYDNDRRWLDPRRPESLVYYWPGSGEPVLVAFMYRKPVGGWPRYARPLLAWHSHTHEGRKGKTQMTHVWLTNGLKSALANCMPVRYLESHLPRFRFRDGPTKGAVHESSPCPE